MLSKLTVTLVVTREDLSKALEVDKDLLDRDLWRCFSKLGTLRIPQQDLIKFLIKQPKFHKWLKAPTSQVLLINANADGLESTSPVTCLSALLLRDLRDLKSIFTLHFFCWRTMRSPQNITDDAAGMLMVFMAQLLHMVPDLSFLNGRQVEAIKEGSDIGVLFIVFEKMLLQLPSKTHVFCVIDNIAFYEVSDQSKDFERVVKRLCGLTMDKSRVIKVLFTCHRQSQFVDHLVDDEDKLSGYGAHQEDHQGLSERDWKSYTKEPLEELEYGAMGIYD